MKHRVELNTASDQKPLTLALSRRERELTEVIARDTPTWNTEPYSNSEINQKPLTLALSPEGEGTDRGDW
jgi:hypothetical protein